MLKALLLGQKSWLKNNNPSRLTFYLPIHLQTYFSALFCFQYFFYMILVHRSGEPACLCQFQPVQTLFQHLSTACTRIIVMVHALYLWSTYRVLTKYCFTFMVLNPQYNVHTTMILYYCPSQFLMVHSILFHHLLMKSVHYCGYNYFTIGFHHCFFYAGNHLVIMHANKPTSYHV